MMNNFKKLALGTLASFCTVVSVQASDQGYDPAIEDELIAVCQSAALNDKGDLRKAVKAVFPTQRFISKTYKVLSDGLLCNGMTVMNFAQYYGAEDTYGVFNRYTPEVKTRIEIKDVSAAAVSDKPIVIEVAMKQ